MQENSISINPDPLLTTEEFANRLRIHPRTLNHWVAQKRYLDLLEPIYIGTKLAFKTSSLSRFLEARVKRA